MQDTWRDRWDAISAEAPVYAERCTLASALIGPPLAGITLLSAFRYATLPSGRPIAIFGILLSFTVAALATIGAVGWLLTWNPWPSRLIGFGLLIYSIPFWFNGSLIWIFLNL